MTAFIPVAARITCLPRDRRRAAGSTDHHRHIPTTVPRLRHTRSAASPAEVRLVRGAARTNRSMTPQARHPNNSIYPPQQHRPPVPHGIEGRPDQLGTTDTYPQPCPACGTYTGPMLTTVTSLMGFESAQLDPLRGSRRPSRHRSSRVTWPRASSHVGYNQIIRVCPASPDYPRAPADARPPARPAYAIGPHVDPLVTRASV